MATGLAAAMQTLLDEAIERERSEFLRAAPGVEGHPARGARSVRARRRNSGARFCERAGPALRAPQIRPLPGSESLGFYPKSLERFLKRQPVAIEYKLPATNCAGQLIGEILETEIYISAGRIPASDLACPSDGESVDQPPETYSSLIAGETSQDKTTVDLFPGPYSARARVRTEHGWSNVSNQAEYEVPGPPR